MESKLVACVHSRWRRHHLQIFVSSLRNLCEYRNSLWGVDCDFHSRGYFSSTLCSFVSAIRWSNTVFRTVSYRWVVGILAFNRYRTISPRTVKNHSEDKYEMRLVDAFLQLKLFTQRMIRYVIFSMAWCSNILFKKRQTWTRASTAFSYRSEEVTVTFSSITAQKCTPPCSERPCSEKFTLRIFGGRQGDHSTCADSLYSNDISRCINSQHNCAHLRESPVSRTQHALLQHHVQQPAKHSTGATA